MTEEGKVKKERDPIFYTCLVVFIIALVAISGATIYSNYIQGDTTTASAGATVTVDYVGTFYDEYGEEHAVIFDTNIWSIVDGDDSVFSNDYVAKVQSSCTPLSFAIGGTTVISAFGNSVLGHKVGDTYTIAISPEDGYVSADTKTLVSSSSLQTTNVVDTLTAAQFKDTYGYSPDGVTVLEKTTYGWPATVSYDSSSNMVVLTYTPVAGQSYTVESEFGTVKLTVSSVSAVINYTLAVSEYTLTGNTVSIERDGAVVVENEIEMIQVKLGSESMYILSVDKTSGDSGAFIYKTVEEKYNQTLYFKITVKSISNVSETVASS